MEACGVQLIEERGGMRLHKSGVVINYFKYRFYAIVKY